MEIDIKYDVRNDSNGLDPDRYSKILKSYHKELWSKTLPNNHQMILTDDKYIYYLLYEEECSSKRFFLSSDIISTTYINWNNHDDLMDIISHFQEKELETFNYLAHTIGSFVLFPHNRIDNKKTINQERGTNERILDRFDLTLDCIRLFYENPNNETPLKDVLNRYKDFFDLFMNFKNYCQFFYLDDLTINDYKEIKFFLPPDSDPLPKNVDEYKTFMTNCITFINSRNIRILNRQK